MALGDYTQGCVRDSLALGFDVSPLQGEEGEPVVVGRIQDSPDPPACLSICLRRSKGVAQ